MAPLTTVPWQRQEASQYGGHLKGQASPGATQEREARRPAHQGYTEFKASLCSRLVLKQ